MRQSILAVDDEPHMLKLLERIVSEKTSYHFSAAGNSLEVPDILQKESFDLIITDLKMPGMDGMDILNFIKEKGRHEEVIIMTAFGSLESATEALSRGVFDYITKPFRKEQILLKIDRAMRWQRARRDSALVSALFDLEPYAEAARSFKEEYMNRLLQRCEGDEDQAIQRSGLDADDIESATRNSD
jgi:DNA-binding NtrC family response regulator